MNLRDWMRGGRSQADQLVVMEGLCAAVHAAHQRNTHYRALSPSAIEVTSDGTCRITDAALRGEPGRPVATDSREDAGVYAAPEVLEKSQFSKKGDIYVVGLILYEMLAGRHPLVVEISRGSFQTMPSVKVAALRDLRPDVSADLADAIGGCLERDPEWRPADLSYLIQLLGQMQGSPKGRGKAGKPAKVSPSSRSAAPAAPGRGDFAFAQRKSSGSRMPLILGLGVLVVGGGAGAWFWMQQQGGAGAGTSTAANTPATPPPATPAPVTTEAATPPPNIPSAAPSVRTVAPAAVTSAATPSPTLAPVPTLVAVATAPPTAAPTTIVTAAPATAAPTVKTPPPTEPPATPPPVAAPPSLRNVAPPKVKRGGMQLLDLHGNDLRTGLQVKVFKGKTTVSGITVPRFKVVNDTLMQVALMIDASTPTGAYSMAVLDPQGHLSNMVPFEITQ